MFFFHYYCQSLAKIWSFVHFNESYTASFIFSIIYILFAAKAAKEGLENDRQVLLLCIWL